MVMALSAFPVGFAFTNVLVAEVFFRRCGLSSDKPCAAHPSADRVAELSIQKSVHASLPMCKRIYAAFKGNRNLRE